MSIISIATTVSSVASAVASIASAVTAVASTTTSTNVNKEENTMSNSVATTSVTPDFVDGQIVSIDDIDVHNKTRSLILLTELDVITNQMLNIAEKYRNETNSELRMRGLNSFLCYVKDYIDTFYRLPEEYRDKATKKTEEWLGTLAGNNFEDIVSSSIEFSRGLYRDLLAEAMNK